MISRIGRAAGSICRTIAPALLLATAMMVAGGSARADGTCPPAAIAVATTPVPMQYVSKLEAHLDKMTRLDQSDAEIVLFGDSLVEGWPAGMAPFDRFKVVNLGIGGDATQNALWRLQQYHPNALAPRYVIMTLGTNNLGAGDPPCGIAEGVRRTIDGLHALWPSAEIVFIAIPPRGDYLDFRDEDRRAANDEIQRAIAERSFAKYVNVDAVISCDFAGNIGFFDRLVGWLFPPAWRCGNYRADAIHFNANGYATLGAVLGGKATN
ncbi:MAG: hypothetical protein J0H11_06485 [Rhizobiales bacterium]|nr:hypothetical protein [Hyphomicrobiales bacterium]